ncbi:hypothetical protein OPT61_g9419 [Boeremia exigua]|uniref:Uncharacterized protein n=1 Tax=Boeremia exigua TaxID=749465 RepID=A0ACC2HUK3_9PLEO|nr:hypothetical protein OPT61_g9419 [Boeremia exigua]
MYLLSCLFDHPTQPIIQIWTYRSIGFRQPQHQTSLSSPRPWQSKKSPPSAPIIVGVIRSPLVPAKTAKKVQPMNSAAQHSTAQHMNTVPSCFDITPSLPISTTEREREKEVRFSRAAGNVYGSSASADNT